MLVTPATTAFVGRGQELATLRAMLARARDHQPAFVLVHGGAGVGKTALIDRFVGGPDEVVQFRVTGDETESGIPYAIVDQLLRLGASAATMSRGAVCDGLARNPVGAGEAVLAAIGNAQAAGTVVLVVDDSQWVDSQSLRAVLFALRRLSVDAVLTVVATRTTDLDRLPSGLRRLADGPTGATIHVEPLTVDELRSLAVDLGLHGFPERAARRLHRHTEGNPLHARALLTEVPGKLWHGPLTQLPAPRSFDAIIGGRLGRLSEQARAIVDAAGVLGLRFDLATVARIAPVDVTPVALDELVAAELIALPASADPAAPVFAHPLVQTVVYRHLGTERRTELHLAASAVTADTWSRLQHLAAATTGTDNQLAAELNEFAARQRSHGAWALAAPAFIAASRLSEDREAGRDRLLNGVYSMLYAGDVAQASAYREEVERVPENARRDCVLGFLAALEHRHDDARTLTEHAWAACDPVRDPGLAAAIAARHAMRSMFQLDGETTVRWSRRALSLMAAHPEWSSPAELLPLGIGLGYAGRFTEGMAAVEAAIGESEHQSTHNRTLSLKRARGWLRCVAGDLRGAHADLSEEAATALRVGSLGSAAFALAQLAIVEYMQGEWDDSLIHGERAIVIANELDHPFVAFGVFATSQVGAASGRFEEVEIGLEQLRRSQPPRLAQGIVILGLARAHLAIARGHAGEVIQALAPVAALSCEGAHEPGFWPWQHLWADALVGDSRTGEAAEVLDRYEPIARQRNHRPALARLTASRARLHAVRGEHGDADELFARAVSDFAGLAMPFEAALARLAWGQALRRRVHRRAAAEQLARARRTFSMLGARPYRERCDVELQAVGLTRTPRSEADRDRLTPQERAVAQLVASGRTNRQVAEELVVSVRTIEFHLTHIYAKLGITSRAQLAAMWARADVATET